MSVNVYLRCDDRLSERDRGDLLGRFRKLRAPDFEVVVNDQEVYLSIDSPGETAALVGAQTVVLGVCSEAGIETSLLQRSLEPRSW